MWEATCPLTMETLVLALETAWQRVLEELWVIVLVVILTRVTLLLRLKWATEFSQLYLKSI